MLKNNRPVYRFVAVKPLARADAASTVEAVVSALEIDCQCSEWKSKLVGVCADGAAVNMGVRSGAAKQLQDIVPHLVPVHCCAHRVELALNTISTQIDYFKTLEDTLLELYKFYHKLPLCESGLQEVGQVLQVKILKPTKLAGTRWVEHRHRALKILLDGWRGFVVHTSQVSLGVTKNKDRARHLHTTLTSLKFFLFSHACMEFLAPIKHFSKVCSTTGLQLMGCCEALAPQKKD